MASDDDADHPDELPPTPLAGLVAEAKTKLAPKPDRHGPAALKAMAAVVRDLKGMPDLIVTRESGTRLRIARKGKVGFLLIAYDSAINAIQVSMGGFSEPVPIGAPASERYALRGEAWVRMEGTEDLFTDLRAHMVRLYPELV